MGRLLFFMAESVNIIKEYIIIGTEEILEIIF